jgi:septin family protein
MTGELRRQGRARRAKDGLGWCARSAGSATCSSCIRSWKPIVDNIESRFDAYLEQENRVNRAKLLDNRVHACIYFIQPTGHS